MTWNVFTSTFTESSSSSMGAGTGLSRALMTLGTGFIITSWQVEADIAIGAGSGTYNTFTTGEFGTEVPWLFGVSYVPTGGTVPNLSSAPDDDQFLFVGHLDPQYDRNTINTAGGPTYKDLYSWRFRREGRHQVNTGVGGGLNWHLANLSVGTTDTGWSVVARITYAQA